jgi:hypothetical protein
MERSHCPLHTNSRSWLNQAVIEIGIFSRQCLGVRRIPDFKTLKREARAWNRRMNRDRIKINWKFDRKAAWRKFGYKWNLFAVKGLASLEFRVFGEICG